MPGKTQERVTIVVTVAACMLVTVAAHMLATVAAMVVTVVAMVMTVVAIVVTVLRCVAVVRAQAGRDRFAGSSAAQAAHESGGARHLQARCERRAAAGLALKCIR